VNLWEIIINVRDPILIVLVTISKIIENNRIFHSKLYGSKKIYTNFCIFLLCKLLCCRITASSGRVQTNCFTIKYVIVFFILLSSHCCVVGLCIHWWSCVSLDIKNCLFCARTQPIGLIIMLNLHIWTRRLGKLNLICELFEVIFSNSNNYK
jgi:hypothetical protein